MNDAVELSFYPLGGFSNPTYNKTVSCASSGVDANCTGDIYESCLLKQFCGSVACPAGPQLKLSKFLDCFEGVHASNMSYADSCAQQSGFDLDAQHACFHDESKANAAWQMVLDAASAVTPTIQCFPWVSLDGTVISVDPTGGCLGEDAGTYPLLQTLCAAAENSTTVATPAVCASPSTFVV